MLAPSPAIAVRALHTVYHVYIASYILMAIVGIECLPDLVMLALGRIIEVTGWSFSLMSITPYYLPAQIPFVLRSGTPFCSGKA